MSFLPNSLDSDEMIERGYAKVVYDDGFKTNMIFSKQIEIHERYVLVVEDRNELPLERRRKHIIPFERIIRIVFTTLKP